MSEQRYTHPLALERMSRGECPECGNGIEYHSGWGGPACTLTDNGVALRIHQYEQDRAAAAVTETREAK
jgi:hypothetical protein